ncbi:MAG: NADH-quinone oxidoreductase subunit J [Planctomycetota bacterium]
MSLGELIYQIIFYAFTVLVIGSALIVAFSPNIIHSAFALLLTFFSIAGIYVFLSSEFLAIAQVVIYVGGILVLILFAVMLTNKIRDVNLSNPSTSPYIAIPLVLIIFIGLVWLIIITPWPVKEPQAIGTIEDIGNALLGKYLLVLEVAAVLLLGALLGAAYLARGKNKGNL